MNENENGLDPRIAALDAAGIGDVAQLTNALKDVQKAKGDISQVGEELLKAVNTLGEGINKIVETKIQDDEAEKLAEAEAKFAKSFHNETDISKKEAIAQKAVAEYGNAIADLALAGNFKKSLMAPVSSSDPREDFIRNFRNNHDLALVLTAVNGGLKRGQVGKDANAKFDRNVWQDTVNQLIKAEVPGMDVYAKAAADAFDTATSGDGSEWVPTMLSRELVDAIFLPLAVASRLRRISMTGKTFELPRIEGRARGVLMAQATSLSDYYTHLAEVNVPSSNKVTFTAQKLGITTPYSYEIDEDAVVPMGEMLLAAIRDGLGASIEDAVINGDVTGFATLDNAAVSKLWTTTSAAQGRDMWHGFRRQVQLSSVTTVDGGTFTITSLRNARKQMGRYGVDPRKLMWVVSTQSYAAFLDLAEVITVDKYGPNATVLTGEIGKVDGVPVVVSEYVYTNLNASGVYDNITTTKTVAVLVYVDAYAFGDRKLVTIEQDKSITAQQNILVGAWRGDMQKLLPDAEKTENVVYNIA